MQITHYVFPENYPNCSESKSYTISDCKLTQMSYITKSPAPKKKNQTKTVQQVGITKGWTECYFPSQNQKNKKPKM